MKNNGSKKNLKKIIFTKMKESARMRMIAQLDQTLVLWCYLVVACLAVAVRFSAFLV